VGRELKGEALSLKICPENFLQRIRFHGTPHEARSVFPDVTQANVLEHPPTSKSPLEQLIFPIKRTREKIDELPSQFIKLIGKKRKLRRQDLAANWGVFHGKLRFLFISSGHITCTGSPQVRTDVNHILLAGTNAFFSFSHWKLIVGETIVAERAPV
jgi:hypothetical protein